MQVCENNWIRRIVGVKREGRRRKDELRVEVGVKEVVRNWIEVPGRFKWPKRMGCKNLANKSDAHKVEEVR